MRTIDLAASKVDLSLLDSFPVKLIHRYNVFPIRRERLAVAGDRAIRSICTPPTRSARPRAGASCRCWPARRSRQADQDAPGRRRETIDGLMAQQRRAQDGVEMLEDIECDRVRSVARWPRRPRSSGWSTRSSSRRSRRGPATSTSSRRQTGMKIRYRIDGVLQTQPMPPEINRFQAAIISRLKIMARLNIAEKRLPQDGRIKLKVARPRGRRPRVDHPHAPRRRRRDAHAGQGRAWSSRCAASAWTRTPTPASTS